MPRYLVYLLGLVCVAGLAGAGGLAASGPGAPARPLAQGAGPAQGSPTPTSTPPVCGLFSFVPSPNGSTHGNYLFAVAGVTANDIWAVGSYLWDGSNYQMLTEHWDGTAW